MRNRWIVLTCGAALAWGAAAGMGAGARSTASAADASPMTDTASDGGAAAAPAPLLPGRPDAPEGGDALGPQFESQSAGIAFRLPAGSRPVLQVSADILNEWGDPQRDWSLKLARMTFNSPMSLQTVKGPDGKEIPGLVDSTLTNLQKVLPEAKVLRQDLTNIQNGDYHVKDNVGLLVLRYTAAAQRRLTQQALIQANDQLFYVLTLTTPARKDEPDPDAAVTAADDPGERTAVETFRQILDSVRLLDRAEIRHDQDERLYRTRALLLNRITGEKMRKILIPEQWLRVLENGKDVGYTYVVEQTAADVPRIQRSSEIGANGQKIVNAKPDVRPGDGILIGIRSRMIHEGVRSDKSTGPIQTDSEAWLFTSANRKSEDWSRTLVVDDHTGAQKQFVQEAGSSNSRIVRVREDDPEASRAAIDPNDPQQPRMAIREEYVLNVEDVATRAGLEPVQRKLPPFYLPQAVGHLLPRLMDLQHPKTYLFYTYISDAREVMARYVDVLPEQKVAFNGQSVRAIRVEDRIGYEGLVTTHYFSPEGVYLGSENRTTHMTVLPTDADTLQRIWQNANLTKPGAVEKPGGAGAAGAGSATGYAPAAAGMPVPLPAR